MIKTRLPKVDDSLCVSADGQLHLVASGAAVGEGGTDGVALCLDVEQQGRGLLAHGALQVEVVVALLRGSKGDLHGEPGGEGEERHEDGEGERGRMWRK